MFSKTCKVLALLIRACGFYLAFALIAVGSLLLGHALIPTLKLFNPKRSKLDNRKLISSAAKLYLSILKVSALLRPRIIGLNALLKSGPNIFAANHPSLLDVVFFIAYVPNCVVIIKSGLIKLSPYAKAAKAAGYLVNYGGGDVVNPMCKELLEGNSVLIFPEGTRTNLPITQNPADYQNWLKSFQFCRGAASVSLRSQIPLVPVILLYSPEILGKGQKWHQVPNKICEATLQFFPPFLLSQDSVDSPLTRRELTEKLENFFKDKLLADITLDSFADSQNGSCFQAQQNRASFSPDQAS